MAKLTLHTYWRSSCSYRVRIALGFKGLAYEPIFVNLLQGVQKDSSYVAVNPTGYVPCLTIDGVPFVESVAIIELLEELHPEPALLPKRPEDRARVRSLVEVVNAGIQPLQNLNVLDRVSAESEPRVAWMKHFMTRGLTALETLVARYEETTGVKGPFLFGESFTMADVYLVPQMYGARRYNLDLTAMPRLVRAEQASLALPFVDAARPEAQPDRVP